MAVTKKGVKWEIRKSLWLVLSFISIFNGIGMYYAGKKAKVKEWCKYGLLYIVVTWISFIASIEFSTGYESYLFNISLIVRNITWIVYATHSFLIRKKYLIRCEMLETEKKEGVHVDTFESKSIDKYEIKNLEESDEDINNKEGREELTPPPFKANIVPPELPNMENNNETTIQKNLLDINFCSEEELSKLPGVGIILAKKAINLRNDKKGFASLDEFWEEVGIKQHFIEKLKTEICCTPMKNVEKKKFTGRMVDF